MNAVGSLRTYFSFTQSMDVDKDSGKNIDFKHRWIRKHGHLKETYAASTKISYIKYFKQKCAVLLYTALKVRFQH